MSLENVYYLKLREIIEFYRENAELDEWNKKLTDLIYKKIFEGE